MGSTISVTMKCISVIFDPSFSQRRRSSMVVM